MKKSLMLVFALALGALAAITGCGNNESSTSPGSAPSTSASTPAAGTPATASTTSAAGTPAAMAAAASPVATGTPYLNAAGKQRVVGFVQTGNESSWRQAHTKSIMNEGAARGVKVIFVDCNNKQETQIEAIRNFITQKVDAIILAPTVADGWDQVLQEAKDAKVPVFLSDRSINTKDDSLYECFVGSDFVKEGEMAGEWLVKKMNGKANIVVLSGEPGSAPAIDRGTGFKNAISKSPDMKIIDEQTGDFKLDEGKQVMESLIKKHNGGKDFNALFTHNDDMALGAIQALKEAGLKPGVDVTIVSVDGVKDAFKAMAAGEMNCTVTCNPLLGHAIFDKIDEFWKTGKVAEKKSFIQDKVYPQDQAAALVDSREY